MLSSLILFTRRQYTYRFRAHGLQITDLLPVDRVFDLKQVLDCLYHGEVFDNVENVSIVGYWIAVSLFLLLLLL